MWGAALAGQCGYDSAPYRPQSAIAAWQSLERGCSLPQYCALPALMGGLVVDAFEVAVLLVDASPPSLGAPAWLIAPLQGARRSDRKCALAGEVEQRYWRWRAYPGGARVWADRYLRPLPWIGLRQRGGEVDGEIPHAAPLRVLVRALMSVAHVRVKARQGAEGA